VTGGEDNTTVVGRLSGGGSPTRSVAADLLSCSALGVKNSWDRKEEGVMSEVMTHGPKVILKFNESILKEIEITQPEFTIGRSSDNDLVIDHAAVSGRHARIVQVQSVCFLEDLKSTNGTFVNDRRIERKQLLDTDVVTIGKHRLIFRDEVNNGRPSDQPKFNGFDKTTVMTGQKVRASGAERTVGVVQIISGRTDRKEYKLTKRLTIIGSQDQATIKLTGYFAPKIAAKIGRRGKGYFISTSEDVKVIHVNSKAVKGQADLKDGDLLEIKGVKMYFFLKEPTQS